MNVLNLRRPSTRPDGIIIMGAVEELRILAQSQMDMRSLAFVLQLGDEHKVALFGGYQRDPGAAHSVFRLLQQNAQWKKSMVYQG